MSEVEAGLKAFCETPILLLWGMKDFVFDGRVLELFEQRWPHAEVHRFEEASHYVLEDAEDEIPVIVRRFLEHHPL